MVEKLPDDRIGTSIDTAADIIRRGGIVVIPTETTYGLAVDPDDNDAVRRLFRIKKRQANKPMLLLIGSIAQVAGLVDEIPPPFVGLMQQYWPGPLTLVFPSSKYKNNPVSGGLSTIGLRLSPNTMVQKLMARMGKPITATSANISGHTAARSAAQAAEMFGGKVDYILDGGYSTTEGFSTVVGYRDGKLVKLRCGILQIALEHI
jgi:L-threonylcarbamoyladenylate synthase